MKKNLLLYILLAFLIVVNGLFLYNYLGRPDGKEPKARKEPGAFIAKELNFDASQMQQFRMLGKEHHKKMRTISDDIKILKDAMFNKISDASIDAQEIDSVTTLIGMKEKAKEAEVFYHFRAIQAICNDEQKKRFNTLIDDARHKNAPPGQRPPGQRPPRKGPPRR